MKRRWVGLRCSTPSLKLRKKNVTSSAARLSTETIAPFCLNSFSAAVSTSSWIPALRKISIVRWWNDAARGWTAVPRCRSTRRWGTPAVARSREVDSPTRLPPTTSTGTWRWVKSHSSADSCPHGDHRPLMANMEQRSGCVNGRRPRNRLRDRPHPHVQRHRPECLSQAVMVMSAVVTTPVWSGVWTVRMAFQVPGSGKW